LSASVCSCFVGPSLSCLIIPDEIFFLAS
jgi:hypothetical protein